MDTLLLYGWQVLAINDHYHLRSIHRLRCPGRIHGVPLPHSSQRFSNNSYLPTSPMLFMSWKKAVGSFETGRLEPHDVGPLRSVSILPRY